MIYLLPERCANRIFSSEKEDFKRKKTNINGRPPYISIKASARDLQFLNELNGVLLGCSKDKEIVDNSYVADIGNLGEQIDGIMNYSKVFMDITKPHCIAVVGTRGSGKSNALGVLYEELVLNNKEVATVVIDPIGVHRSSFMPNDDSEQLYLLRNRGLQSKGVNCQILIPSIASHDFSDSSDGVIILPISSMYDQDWCDYWQFTSNSPQSDLMRLLIVKCKGGYTSLNEDYINGKDEYDFSDLRKCLAIDKEINDPDKGYSNQTIRSINLRLNTASMSGLFSKKGTSISNISIPGISTIIDVSHPGLSLSEKGVVVAITTRKILEARILSARVGSDIIPPTWLLIEESQLFTTKGTGNRAVYDLINYAKTGRAAGCSLVLCTQQPSAIPSGIQSQIDLVISFRLTMAGDIDSLRKFTPTVQPPEIYSSGDFIRGLFTGYAIVADQCTQNRPIIVSVRPRMSKHEGSLTDPKALSNNQQIGVSDKPISRTINISANEFKDEGVSIMEKKRNEEMNSSRNSLSENEDMDDLELVESNEESDILPDQESFEERCSESKNADQERSWYAFIIKNSTPKSIVTAGIGFILAMFIIHSVIFQSADEKKVASEIQSEITEQEEQVESPKQKAEKKGQNKPIQRNLTANTPSGANLSAKPEQNKAESQEPDITEFNNVASSIDDISIMPTLMNTINILEDKE